MRTSTTSLLENGCCKMGVQSHVLLTLYAEHRPVFKRTKVLLQEKLVENCIEEYHVVVHHRLDRYACDCTVY